MIERHGVSAEETRLIVIVRGKSRGHGIPEIFVIHVFRVFRLICGFGNIVHVRA